MAFKIFIGILFAGLIFSCKPTAQQAKPQTKSITKSAPADASQYPYAVPLMDPSKKNLVSYEVLPDQNKPTVVLFWLTTCKPCAKELTAIQQNFETWQKIAPFHLVALSEDHMDDYAAFVQRVKKEQWPFASYIDVERKFQDLLPGNLNGLPQTFIFDKEGNLTWKKRGFLPGDESQYLEKIKEAAGI